MGKSDGGGESQAAGEESEEVKHERAAQAGFGERAETGGYGIACGAEGFADEGAQADDREKDEEEDGVEVAFHARRTIPVEAVGHEREVRGAAAVGTRRAARGFIRLERMERLRRARSGRFGGFFGLARGGNRGGRVVKVAGSAGR